MGFRVKELQGLGFRDHRVYSCLLSFFYNPFISSEGFGLGIWSLGLVVFGEGSGFGLCG